MRFRKRPVVIEAVQWDGDNWSEVVHSLIGASDNVSQNGTQLRVVTLEGTMMADPGDWIIKGVKGEIYPCKPDIFEATYEEVES